MVNVKIPVFKLFLAIVVVLFLIPFIIFFGNLQLEAGLENFIICSKIIPSAIWIATAFFAVLALLNKNYIKALAVALIGAILGELLLIIITCL